MGRHETFENASPIADELLAGTILGQVAPRVAETYPVAISESDPSEGGADAGLLRLGRQFEAARACEIAACEACNAAEDEANRRMPERPAALSFRGSDHPLRLRKYLTHPDALEGEEVTADDVAWMKRRPYVRQVSRAVRPEDNLPPDARTVVEAHPWPEAQDRADEIVAAWDAWHAERLRIHGEYVTAALDDAANEAGEIAAAIATRIAALPATTAAGFRVKLRALKTYNPRALLSEIPDEPDPDQMLSHSLWRDVQGELPTPSPADTLTNDILDLWRVWALQADQPEYDEALSKRRYALIDAAEALPATLENIAPKALALAWLEYVALWQKGCGRSDYATDGRLALDIHAVAARTPPAAPAATAAPREPSLVDMIDFASVSLDDLQSLHDLADLVGSVAYAAAWTGRCKARGPGNGYNAAGNLMQWLGDALTDVETAANEEARRRIPPARGDRETRLKMLALPVIQNGDLDEIEAFARDLLTHVEAERTGR